MFAFAEVLTDLREQCYSCSDLKTYQPEPWSWKECTNHTTLAMAVNQIGAKIRNWPQKGKFSEGSRGSDTPHADGYTEPSPFSKET